MSSSPTLTALAEAVADGSAGDWAAAESHSTDPAEQELARYLLAAAAIGRRRAALYTLSLGPNDPSLVQPTALAPGDTWGSLRIVEHIGRGRFGDVYKAYDATLDREVALKILRTSAGESDSSPSAVVHEGRMMARVRHANVMTIHGAQTIDGRTGLWMEFIEGRTLAAELKQSGPMSSSEVTAIGSSLCDALAAVHDAGLVHRDVKALNVLREKTGRIVLGDFGTGRVVADGAGMAALVGTPAYLAPEIFSGQPATARSDLYSLGALLYYLATGGYPVDGGSIAALRQSHAQGARRLLRAQKPDWPAALVAVIDRALSPNPEDRFGTAREMRQALEDARPGGRTRNVLVAASLACAVLLGSGYYAWRSSPAPAQESPRQVILAVTDRTGDPTGQRAVAVGLERALTASASLKVMPRDTIDHTLRLMRRPVATSIDAGVGREIALRRGGVHAVVTAEASLTGQGFTLSADVVAPSDGALVASLSATGRTMDAAARELASKVATTVTQRAEFGAVTKGYPDVTTSSFRALTLLMEAKDMANNDPASTNAPSTPERVELLARRALEEDPQFAMAHSMLADSLRYMNRVEESRRHIELARAHVTRNFEPEYLYITGMADYLEGILADRGDPARRAAHHRAVSAFEALIRLQPDEWIPHLSLLRAYREVYRHEEADRLQMRLSDLRPHLPGAQARGAAAAIARGDIVAARKYMDRLKGVELTFAHFAGQVAWLRLFEGHVAWLEFDPDHVRQVADQVLPELSAMPAGTDMRRHGLATQLHWLYLSIGRTRDAEKAAIFIHPGVRPGMLGRILSQRGETDAIRQLLSSMQKTDIDGVEPRGRLASLYIEVGDVRSARAILDELTQRYLYEGQMALAENRLEDAIAHLRSVQSAPEDPGNPLWRGEIPRSLATAFVRAGRTDDAIQVLETSSDQRGLAVARGSAGYEWIRVRDDLAVLYRQVGRTADAERVEAELRTLLALADDDHIVKRRLDALAQTTTR